MHPTSSFLLPIFFPTPNIKPRNWPPYQTSEWESEVQQWSKQLDSLNARSEKFTTKTMDQLEIQFLCHVLMTAVPQLVLIQSRHSGQFNPSRHFWQVRLPHPACQPSTPVLEQKTPNEILQTAKGACPPLNSYSRGLLVPVEIIWKQYMMKGILYSWGVTEVRLPPPSLFSTFHAAMQRICGCLLDWIFLCAFAYCFCICAKAATYQQSSQRCTLQFRGINVTCLATTRQNGHLSQAQCLGIVWAPEKGGIFHPNFMEEKKLTSSQALETFKNSWVSMVSCHGPFFSIQKTKAQLALWTTLGILISANWASFTWLLAQPGFREFVPSSMTAD